MPKRKAKNSTSNKPGADKKCSTESPISPLSSNNVASTFHAAVPLSSNTDELFQTQAALKALQDRFAEEKKALQTQNKQLQTQNKQLHSRNERLDMQLVQQEQNSTAMIKDLLFEVDELKTELALFRCD